MKTLLVLAALSLAAPAAALAQDEPSDVTVLASHWSLDRAPKRRPAQVHQQQAQPQRKSVKSASKPRIFGGAAVTNGRRKGNRSAGEVGVALPF